jgi:hypothetical protein
VYDPTMRKRSPLLSTYQLLLGAALSVVVLDLGAGCGAMFNSSTVGVPVNVAPQGARISVDGLYVAQAPGVVALTNASSHTVDLDADGYQRQSARLESRPDGGYVALDCLLLVLLIVPGIVALIVDASTGDWKTLDNPQISAALVPAAGYPAPYGGSPWSPPPGGVPPASAGGGQWSPPPQAPAGEGAQPSGPAGCQYDVQCKNDRVCKAGQCVEPSRAH